MIAKPSRAAPSHGTPLHGRNNDDDDELVQPGSNFTFFSRSRFRQSISVGTRIDTPSGPQLLVSFRSVPFRIGDDSTFQPAGGSADTKHTDHYCCCFLMLLLRNHAAPRFGGVPLAVFFFVSLEVQQLFFVDRSAAVLSDQRDGVDGIHVVEFDEGDRHHDGGPSQARHAVDGNAGPGHLGGGTRGRGVSVVECLVDDPQPLVDDLLRRRVAVGVFHVVAGNPRRRELSRLVGRLADPHQIGDGILAHFPYV
mmetsp:Transcript_102365/g.208351  ORF Transcript_102365/g.208351 Transcript_102365/m.208351 type:complete len:252 (-) Transcript_102365:856-1611(-)